MGNWNRDVKITNPYYRHLILTYSIVNGFRANLGKAIPKIMKDVNIKTNGKLLCEKCKKKIKQEKFHIHHLMPHSMGGSDNFENLTLICLDCHKEIHKHQL